jgi:hypothetical protein
MPIPQWIIKTLKTIFSDVRKTIIGIIVLAILGGTGGVLYLSKTALSFSIAILTIPTPLWATIVLVLLVIAYIKMKKSSPSSASNYIIKYFTIGKFKWKTKIYDYGYFEIDKYPFCITHDLQFIYGDNSKYCPGTEKEKCNNRIYESDFSHIYESAKSNIDKLVRNKQY